MAGISAVTLGDKYLTVLEEVAKSPLIRSKQEALLFISNWLGSALRDNAASFNEPKFRDDALQMIYFPVKSE